MDSEKLMQGILDEASKLFGQHYEKVKPELIKFGEIILKLRVAKFMGSAEQVKELEKSEQYVWQALKVLKSEMTKDFNESAWTFAEKLMNLMKKVLLS